MPEGDAVRRTANRLDQVLAGQVLASTDFRVPHLATTDLAGATVVGTATHGKHLLTRLRTVDGRDLSLHTHLKMEGSWRFVAGGSRWPGPAHEARVVLRTHAVEAIGFRLGIVDLFATAQEPDVTGHLGPDLLGSWTPQQEANAVARLTRTPQRVLAESLLDQTVVTGMGTIWVAEACFVHGISPLAPNAALSDPERFLRRTRQMMQAAVSHGRPLTTGDRRQPLWAYRRHRQPCLRCRTSMIAGPVGGPGRERTTYWCPACQPSAR